MEVHDLIRVRNLGRLLMWLLTTTTLSAACGLGNAKGPISSSGPGSVGRRPEATQTGVGETVLNAYSEMWHAYADAAKTSDYESSELGHYAAGEARALIVQALYRDHQQGVASRGEPVLAPRIADLVPSDRPTRADVLDCADGSGWRRYDKTGRPVGGAEHGRRRVQASLRFFGGTWKVTTLIVQRAGTC